jgi:hypothetical protein
VQGLADAEIGRHEAGAAAEALAATTKEAALLRERLNHATNRMGQLEHKVGGCTAGLPRAAGQQLADGAVRVVRLLGWLPSRASWQCQLDMEQVPAYHGQLPAAPCC